MAKTFTAPFGQDPRVALAKVTTAVALTPNGVDSQTTVTNSALLLSSGTTNTAGPEGALMTGLSALPLATVTASQLCIWSSTDGGTTKNLILTALMPAYTLAATTQNVPVVFKHADNSTPISETAPYRLAANERLYGGTLVTSATGILFAARLTDF